MYKRPTWILLYLGEKHRWQRVYTRKSSYLHKVFLVVRPLKWHMSLTCLYKLCFNVSLTWPFYLVGKHYSVKNMLCPIPRRHTNNGKLQQTQTLYTIVFNMRLGTLILCFLSIVRWCIHKHKLRWSWPAGRTRWLPW